ncbi:MAG: VanZ family protein, partial [Clostridiales bacterium]|nr:VanZ family protein [Clostridiales bacterium]
LFTVCFAMTDEFHQLFISGRAGQITDVGIDALGSLIMAIIVWNLGKMLKYRKENRKYLTF